MAGVEPTPPPADLRRARAARPQTWLFLAAGAESLDPYANAAKELLFGRHKVLFGYAGGQVSPTVSALVRRHRLTPAGGAPRPVRPLVRAGDRFGPSRVWMRGVGRWDPWLVKWAGRSDHVLYLDPLAGVLRSRLETTATGARHWGADEVSAVLEEEHHWRTLHHLVRSLAHAPEQARLPMGGITRTVRWLLKQPDHLLGPDADLRAPARLLAHRLLRGGGFVHVDTLLAACDLMKGHHPDGVESAALEVLRAHVALSVRDEQPEDLPALVASVLGDADRAFEQGAIADAASRAAIGIDLMFHQQLHADVDKTPLVETPGEFVAPLYDSAVGRLLTGPAAAQAPSALPARGTTQHRRVTVLPGAYPWHATRMIEALEQDPRAQVGVLRLDASTFRGMGLGHTFVRHRLALGAGQRPDDEQIGVTQEQRDLLSGSDVVVADWADKGAVWASTTLPEGCRMVVRVHSIDVLSPALHLTDWTRVGDVVFVGEHIRAIFLELLGERATHLRTHVIPNIVRPATAAREPGPMADRTLAMVGWAQRVKDPMMAVEILAGLRRLDPAWRLRLLGADFTPNPARVLRAYAEGFRRRILRSDVVDSIDFVGQTSDVEGHLAGTGFILSTSLRESFHIGAMEGVVSGAYPVVREWPTYAKHAGAARLFPRGSVFDTAEEAVEVIWALRGHQDRLDAVAAAQREMGTVLSGTGATDALRRVVLG